MADQYYILDQRGNADFSAMQGNLRRTKSGLLIPEEAITAQPHVHRTGVASGQIPAGTDDNPGKGKAIWDRLQLSPASYEGQEETAVDVYNVGKGIIAANTRVVGEWCWSIKTGDKWTPGYLVRAAKSDTEIDKEECAVWGSAQLIDDENAVVPIDWNASEFHPDDSENAKHFQVSVSEPWAIKLISTGGFSFSYNLQWEYETTHTIPQTGERFRAVATLRYTENPESDPATWTIVEGASQTMDLWLVSLPFSAAIGGVCSMTNKMVSAVSFPIYLNVCVQTPADLNYGSGVDEGTAGYQLVTHSCRLHARYIGEEFVELG